MISTFEASYRQQVIDLIIAIQREEFEIPITAGEQPDLVDIPSFYQRDKGNFWVAVHDDEVVGTVALLDIGNDQVALRKMFVKEKFRGREFGVAKALLDTAFEWVRKKGVTHIFLGTTEKFKAAHRFYEKNGFTEILQNELPNTFPVMKVDTKFYRF